jgi:hypothetical protein
MNEGEHAATLAALAASPHARLVAPVQQKAVWFLTRQELEAVRKSLCGGRNGTLFTRPTAF